MCSADPVAEHVLVARNAPGLPPSVAREAVRLPGVIAATGTLGTTAFGEILGEEEERVALGVDGRVLGDVLALGIGAGDLADLRPGTVAVSEHQARNRGWAIGDRVRLRANDGLIVPVTIRRHVRPLARLRGLRPAAG